MTNYIDDQTAPTPVDRRRATERRIAKHLYAARHASRAEVSRATGLSKQAISEAVARLVQHGLLVERGKSDNELGRKALDFAIANTGACSFAADIGGSKITAALIGLAGDVLAHGTMPTDPNGGIAVIDQLTRIRAQLLDARGLSDAACQEHVLGVPGVPDLQSGAVRLASNIAGWSDMNVAGALRERFGPAVFLENDVNMAALGELSQDADGQAASFGFVNLGTGIGLGIILNGALVRGGSGAAGEIAFLPLGQQAEAYDLTPEGPLEHKVGTHGLMAGYWHHGGAGADTVAELLSKVAEGEQAAINVLDEAANFVALALLSVRAVVDLSDFVLGGGIGSQSLVRDAIEKALVNHGVNDVRLRISKLGDRAGLLGCAHQARRSLADRLFGFSAAGDAIPMFGNAPLDLSTSLEVRL